MGRMFDQRHSARSEAATPITFRLGEREASGELVNLSGTGALFRFHPSLPFGPEALGQTVTFTSSYDVGALLKPQGTVVRYFEEPQGKHLAVRYLPD